MSRRRRTWQDKQLARLAPAHALIADWLLAHPAWTHAQLAAHFGYSAKWVGRIVTSPVFFAYMERRRTELMYPLIRESLRLRRCAGQST